MTPSPAALITRLQTSVKGFFRRHVSAEARGHVRRWVLATPGLSYLYYVIDPVARTMRLSRGTAVVIDGFGLAVILVVRDPDSCVNSFVNGTSEQHVDTFGRSHDFGRAEFDQVHFESVVSRPSSERTDRRAADLANPEVRQRALDVYARIIQASDPTAA